MNRIIASGVLLCGTAGALFAARQLRRASRALDAAVALQAKHAALQSRHAGARHADAEPLESGGLHREYIRPPEFAAALPPEDPHAPPSPRLQPS